MPLNVEPELQGMEQHPPLQLDVFNFSMQNVGPKRLHADAKDVGRLLDTEKIL